MAVAGHLHALAALARASDAAAEALARGELRQVQQRLPQKIGLSSFLGSQALPSWIPSPEIRMVRSKFTATKML